MNLADRMKTHPLTVDEMKLVVLRLAEAMKFLHQRDIVHGSLDTSLVSVDIVDGVYIIIILNTSLYPSGQTTTITDKRT